MLLTASLLFAGMTTTFAQVPDASGWKEGDDITDKVNWGNLSFMEDDFSGAVENPHWHFESSAGGPLGYEEHGPSFAEFGFGVFECFNGADEDLYQYVELPAGMYRLECQAYYRFGTAWADDPAAFGTAEWKDNAMLYASNGIYDIDSKEFTAGRTFRPLLCHVYSQNRLNLFIQLMRQTGRMMVVLTPLMERTYIMVHPLCRALSDGLRRVSTALTTMGGGQNIIL